eukprot:gene16375-biopygen20275
MKPHDFSWALPLAAHALVGGEYVEPARALGTAVVSVNPPVVVVAPNPPVVLPRVESHLHAQQGGQKQGNVSASPTHYHTRNRSVPWPLPQCRAWRASPSEKNESGRGPDADRAQAGLLLPQPINALLLRNFASQGRPRCVLGLALAARTPLRVGCANWRQTGSSGGGVRGSSQSHSWMHGWSFLVLVGLARSGIPSCYMVFKGTLVLFNLNLGFGNELEDTCFHKRGSAALVHCLGGGPAAPSTSEGVRGLGACIRMAQMAVTHRNLQFAHCVCQV